MEHGQAIIPNPWMMLPFGLLLATIALGPLFFLNWWEKHYPKVAYVLGAITLTYYLGGLHAYETVMHTGIEYISFIALVGSLYVVSGGIHINVKGEATPFNNVLFLLFGAVIANVLGTTGASMLLIRPWIRMNKYRITAHHIVFFIFIVSNVGGCLTPIGDPPLFLGFLKGIPFWWVMKHCWPMWLVGIGVLLTMFYVVDSINYRKAPKEVREEIAEPPDQWKFDGHINMAFLGVILFAVFIPKPLFLREALIVGAAIGSYFMTQRSIHEANHFNFHPIQEVAILFVGIFSTMMPALDWLKANASSMEQTTPGIFYWGTGLLSGVLDNAPTYLSFLSATVGKFAKPEMLAQASGIEPGAVTEVMQIQHLLATPELLQYVVAISVAAVFFGANTYIGNGPNFMVKSIADQQKVHAPSFLGYVFKFTIPYMLPTVLIVWFIFFR